MIRNACHNERVKENYCDSTETYSQTKQVLFSAGLVNLCGAPNVWVFH